MAWEVDFYEDGNGHAPVEAFLEAIADQKALGKLLQRMDMLKEFGIELPFPYCSQVEGKLRELRTRYGNVRYRLLYYQDIHHAFVLLYGIEKKTEKLQESDKRRAWKRMEDDQARKSARKRLE